MGTEGRLQARTKKLHAMKKFLSAVATAALSLFAQAQNTDAPMATLQHGDQTRVWMGVDAFIKAYEAAADSADVITLSSGNFRVPNEISKSFRLYGAGCEDDPLTGTKATVLNGLSFRPADITNEDGETVKAGRKVNGLHLEGISASQLFFEDNSWTAVENLTIAKCKVTGMMRFYIPTKNVTIRQSIIARGINTNMQYTNYFHTNLLVTNTYLGSGIERAESESSIHVDHCIIRGSLPSTLCTNSILYSPLNSGSTSKNNIFIGQTSIGSGVQGSNNWTNVANAGVYAAEGEDGTYAENKTFELKYPKKYVGTDGTEIGLHGGNYPWNKIPCTPRIMESNIDTKTSADGKLKVSIKVEAQTKD